MEKNTLENIEEKIRTYDVLSEEKKSELLSLIGKLKSEISELSDSKSENAESIVGFMERSAHEATRKNQNQIKKPVELSIFQKPQVISFIDCHPFA